MSNERRACNVAHSPLRAARGKALGPAAVVLLTSGCSRSPAFNVLGSYFPDWIACLAVAVVLTFAAHALFTKLQIVNELWPLPLLYPALVCFMSCTVWLIAFS